MAAQLEELYEADFYAWTRSQAAALRQLADERWNGPLDLAHLAEEVEDLGKAERNGVRSQLRRVIEHCLKLEFSPAIEPRVGWKRSIADARSAIEDSLTATIRADVEEQLPRLYRQARLAARLALVDMRETEAAQAVPELCHYTLDDLLAEQWHPANQHGLVDEI
jgi:hypothetical protein